MAVLEERGLNQSAFHISEAMAGDYLALLKPRVMSLVVFTALVGLVTTPAAINPFIAAVALLAIAVGAGASGALNMWYDADIDAVMSRTAKRPVPRGRILPKEALGFGVVLSAFAVMTLGLVANWFAAGFLAFTIVFYAVFYTMYLKRRTPQNIVIGGAAGAFPPMIGAAAVTGGFTLDSFILFLIIFLWTPPHFWALALFKSDDYARAGVPMLPNVAGAGATKRQIMAYSVLLAVSGLLPWIVGSAGPAYGIVAAALGAGFVWYGWKVLRMAEDDETMLPAKALFGYSLFYLFAVFAAFLLDALFRGIGASLW